MLFELGPGEDPDARLRRQKERGERFVRFFAGDWRERAIVFWDSPLAEDGCDECASREEAVDKAYSMLTRMGFQVLGDLASNKWLSVW